MKAKAKPTKGSARVKKFDRGGTIGALAGLGTLAYLMRDKFGKKDEAKSSENEKTSSLLALKDRLTTPRPADTSSIDGGNPTNTPGGGGRAGTIIPEPGRKLSVESETDNERAANIEGKPAQSNIYKAQPGEGYAKPVEPIKTTVKKKPIVKAKPTEASPSSANEGSGASTQKPYIKQIGPSAPGKEPVTMQPADNPMRTAQKPYPEKEAAAKKAAEEKKAADAKKAKDKSGSGFGPKNTFLTEERSKQANKAVGNAWRAQNPGLASLFGGKKKGGVVKKMAKGGSVSPTSSASKRADGIAQRGKTRGKMY